MHQELESPTQLFRIEAIQAREKSSSQFGTVEARVPVSWAILTLVLLVFIGSVVIFLLSVDFARKETVRGKLRLNGPEAKVYALDNGLVSDMNVANGQLVRKGEPVATIETERALSGGRSLGRIAIDTLQNELENVNNRENSIRRGRNLAKSDILEQLGDAETQIEELTKLSRLTEQQISIARTREQEGKQFLDEGLITEPQYAERLSSLLNFKQTLLQLNTRKSSASTLQARLRIELPQIDNNLEQDLAALNERKSQLVSQIAQAEARQRQIILAPIEGVVTGVSKRSGEFAEVSQPLVTILPKDTRLIAELYVPSRAIAFVQTGQTVNLKYDAFPYQKFGTAKGRITDLARTAYSLNELGVQSQSNELFYRVEVSLERTAVTAFGSELPLQSGMEMSADIILENRSMMDWILEPLKSLG